jgi:AraC-like DNA-binding protein
VNDITVLDRNIFDDPSQDFFVNTCPYDKYDEILVHKHKFVEINYIISGNGIHHINGKHYDVSIGDLYLIMPGTTHVYYPYDIRNTKKFATLNCIFYTDFLFSSLNEWEGLRNIYDFFTDFSYDKYSSQKFYRFKDDDKHTLGKICDRMLREYHLKLNGYDHLIKEYLSELIIMCYRSLLSINNNIPAENTAANDSIYKAIHYLEENYLNPISLDDICSKAALSKCYFCTQFKKIMGVSVIHYLQKIRIEKAMELLEKSEYKISTISQMVGYSDYNFFTQTFKKVNGQTPRVFRQNIEKYRGSSDVEK